ncbi:MAG: hypothetical protein EBR30_03260 [Cytophagia bacterium]|nr:hypothetical protein [Cytophagia bacterium]
MEEFNHKHYNYKWTRGFILAICMLLLLLSAAAFSQTATVDVTGNLVNNTQTANTTTSTWQGGTFVNSLTCWAPGDPGYCGPNAMIRPDGNINFSYGLTNLYQNVNVAKALPYSGTNLVTTGYRFQWTSKNGNGWDNGQLDQLSAYVNLYDKGGSNILESYNYNLTFLHNWTSFDWKQDWSKLRRPNEVSNVQFGFVGMDTNYWAGPYGPEINNVSFQLKYKPDPCVNNPLYSPDCPKFQETLQKNLATTTTTTDPVKPPPSEFDTQQPHSTNQPKPSDGPMMGEKEPGVYEGDSFHVDMDRLIDTLFKIEDNQEKEQKLTQEASTNAIRETEKSSQQTTRLAEQVAAKAVRQSIESASTSQQQVSTEQTNKENKSQQSMSLFQAPTAVVTGTFQLPNSQQQFSVLQSPGGSSSTSTVLTQESTTRVQNTSVVNLNLSNAVQQQAPISVSSIQQNIVQQSQNNIAVTNPLQLTSLNPLVGQIHETPILQSNFLTNKADPINSIIESKPQTEEKKQDTNTKQVKSNVQDNDAAAGVSIANIARSPIGFNNYMVALTDVAFYAPKEIYRNQKNVDNARALRQLASDRLHQQMVDQQYLPR